MHIRSFWKKVFSLDTTMPPSEALSFLSTQGHVIESIEPGATGRVRLQGVSWLARCSETLSYPVPVDTSVRIIDRMGLVLMIEPILPLSIINFPLSETYSGCRVTVRQRSHPNNITAA